MRHSSTKSRAAWMTAAAALAVAGFGTAAQAALTVDLKVHGTGATTATLHANENVTLDVFGTVTGGSNDGIQDVFFGVSNAGTSGDLSAVSYGPTYPTPFGGVATDTGGNVTTSTSGSFFGSPGSLSVGSPTGNSGVADGWVFARSTTMTTVTDGVPKLLGTLTYTAKNNATAGSSAVLSIIPRTTSAATPLVIPAVWQMNGQEQDGNYTVGSSVTISIASAALLGDVNGDGAVDSQDIDPFIWALSANDEADFLNNYAIPGGFPNAKYSNADTFTDGSIDSQDIDPFINILVNQAPGGIDVSALVAVPEPTSLSLLGLGAMGLVARRRKA